MNIPSESEFSNLDIASISSNYLIYGSEWISTYVLSMKKMFWTAPSVFEKIFNFQFEKILSKIGKKTAKIWKIMNFQILIKLPIWPIFSICKLDKVSLGIFTWFSKYWANRHIIRRKIGFFEVKCHFWAFSHKCKNRFFVEYSTNVEISTMKFSEKKLMCLVDIHNKYLKLTLITYENIQKVNRVTFFQPHSRK